MARELTAVGAAAMAAAVKMEKSFMIDRYAAVLLCVLHTVYGRFIVG